jgi:hypothetical protein
LPVDIEKALFYGVFFLCATVTAKNFDSSGAPDAKFKIGPLQKEQTMIPPISNQIPRGEQLTQAVSQLQRYDEQQNIKTQIQDGVDASNNLNAPRTAHGNFMAEIKAEIMVRINAR